MKGFQMLLNLLAGFTLSRPGWLYHWGYEFRVLGEEVVGRALLQLPNNKEVRWYKSTVAEVRARVDLCPESDFALTDLFEGLTNKSEVLALCPELAV